MAPNAGRNHLRLKQQVQSLFSSSRTLIYVAGFILYPFVAYVQLKDISLVTVITNTGGYFLTQCGLIVYYNSWIMAGNSDSKMFESVYAIIPDGDKIPPSMFIQIPVLFAAAALLFFTSKNEHWLALSLLLFFVVDVLAWLNMARLARPMIMGSAEHYFKRGEIYEFEKLKQAALYLCGFWQWKRYWVLAIILAVYESVVFVGPVHAFIGIVGNSYVPEISPDTIASFTTGLIFCAYIFIAEVSVWSVRLRTKAVIEILDEQQLSYNLDVRAER